MQILVNRFYSTTSEHFPLHLIFVWFPISIRLLDFLCLTIRMFTHLHDLLYSKFFNWFIERLQGEIPSIPEGIEFSSGKWLLRTSVNHFPLWKWTIIPSHLRRWICSICFLFQIIEIVCIPFSICKKVFL